jgi:SAM-dependent methyltransferase
VCLAVLVASCSRAASGTAPGASASAALRSDAIPLGAAPTDAAVDRTDDPDADPLEVEAEREWRGFHHGNIVYVPTPQTIVDRMLAVARIDNNDLVYDLGCGDGRIVITAAQRFGAHAVGFDLDPARVAEARENVRQAGVDSLVTIRRADLFSVDLSPATVVTMYLHPRIDARLLPDLARLAPGTRIVSHDFDLRDRRVHASPDGRWMLTAPFFGYSNEFFEAGVPEDAAHYPQHPHWVYLWTAPLKLEPLPAPRDELLQGSTPYERFLAREDLEEKFEAGHAIPADIRALIADCKQFSSPGFDCAARYRVQPASKP